MLTHIGSRSKSFNARGRIYAGVRVTEGVAPGVVIMSTGAWFEPGFGQKNWHAVEQSGNTNRQIHALREHTGQAKTEVMAERIRAINPECQVTCVDDFVTVDNVAEYLNHGFSYVIDAIDSVRPKAALLAYCRRYKIPVVTTGGAGGQIDPTRISVVDLAKTIQDPLAAKLRERLKHDFNVVKNSKGRLGIDCVFSDEPLVYPQADGSVCASCSTAEGVKRMDCASGFGAATMVTATFGFVAVSHALKKMMAKAAREAQNSAG